LFVRILKCGADEIAKLTERPQKATLSGTTTINLRWIDTPGTAASPAHDRCNRSCYRRQRLSALLLRV
jgi:hypothetical protein